MRTALVVDQTSPGDIASFLAEQKARKAGAAESDAMVIGCDQVLGFKGGILSKPANLSEAIAQLMQLRGNRHDLYSAAAIYQNGQPLWRHVGHVRLFMRAASEDYVSDYAHRNWDSIRHSVGGYNLEEEGIRLFRRIEGDYFHVLGLPLIELLAFLTDRGTIPG